MVMFPRAYSINTLIPMRWRKPTETLRFCAEIDQLKRDLTLAIDQLVDISGGVEEVNVL